MAMMSYKCLREVFKTPMRVACTQWGTVHVMKLPSLRCKLLYNKNVDSKVKTNTCNKLASCYIHTDPIGLVQKQTQTSSQSYDTVTNQQTGK